MAPFLFRRYVVQASLLGFIFLCHGFVLSCKPVGFQGFNKTAPLPPPPELPVTLEVIQLNPESWWKSCVYAVVNKDESKARLVSCNKDSDSPGIGSPVTLWVKPKVCNTVRLDVYVFKPEKECVPGKPCDGPFQQNYHHLRSPAKPEDLPFFRFYDARQLKNIDPIVRLDPKVGADANAMAAAQAESFIAAGNTWVRMYFEDQTNAALERFMKAGGVASRPAVVKKGAGVPADDPGIDFNDYVIEIKGTRVQLAVEGTGQTCP